MSYGIEIYSEISGELLVSQQFPTPVFVGKVTLGTAFSQTILPTSLTAEAKTITMPAGVSSENIIFWTIPESIDDNVFFCPDPGAYTISHGLNGAVCIIRPTSGGSYSGWPEGYVFNLVPGTTASGESRGGRVYGVDGITIHFDSGRKHLQLHNIIAEYLQSGTSSLVTTYGPSLPSKPGFLVSTYASEIWTQRPAQNAADGTAGATGVRRAGNNLTTKSFDLASGYEDAAINGSVQFGSNNGALPIINAAFYD